MFINQREISGRSRRSRSVPSRHRPVVPRAKPRRGDQREIGAAGRTGRSTVLHDDPASAQRALFAAAFESFANSKSKRLKEMIARRKRTSRKTSPTTWKDLRQASTPNDGTCSCNPNCSSYQPLYRINCNCLPQMRPFNVATWRDDFKIGRYNRTSSIVS